MWTKQLLTDWGNPIIHSSEGLLDNAKVLAETVMEMHKDYELVNIIGTGKSGTCFMTAYTVWKKLCNWNLNTCITVYEKGCDFRLFPGPAILVDDHVKTGRTLKEIKEMMWHEDYLKVRVIVARKANLHEELIKELYPKVKVIIY